MNPDLIARRRGLACKKDDSKDARIACLLGLDRFASLKPLIPHGEIAEELRSVLATTSGRRATSGGS